MKLTTSSKKDFKPIDVNIEFTIECEKEFDNLKREFEDGVFENFNTHYSRTLYDLIRLIKNSFK